MRAIALAATTATRTWTGVTRTRASESARGGARSVRASAATIPLSGYGRDGLRLRRFLLLAVDAGPLVGDEQPAVRALEPDVAVGAARHELGLESLAAMRTDDLVGAFRGRERQPWPKDSHERGCYAPRMSPQRRTALVSVFAALVLIALKLVAGIHSGSLGLLSEAAHSGTDLVAALLTFFAVGVAGRPPDVGHPYGHGKAENLGALAEAAILVVAALVIAASSVFRLVQGGHTVHVDAFALSVIGVVVVVDASRAVRFPRGVRAATRARPSP